jgi:hypothetical protein
VRTLGPRLVEQIRGPRPIALGILETKKPPAIDFSDLDTGLFLCTLAGRGETLKMLFVVLILAGIAAAPRTTSAAVRALVVDRLDIDCHFVLECR